MKSLLKKVLIGIYFGNPIFRKGIKFGRGSYVREHSQIGGGKHIEFGDNVRVSQYCRLMCFENISGEQLSPSFSVGDNTWIGRNCTISCTNRVDIGRDCLITGYAFLCDSEHGMDPECNKRYETQPMIKKIVKIGNNVFIGDKAMILPGTTIGDNCIVGAGSVVKGDFESNSLIAGNPARIIKRYSYNTHKWEQEN